MPYSEPKGVVNTFGRLSASGTQIDGARNRMDLIVWSEHRDDVETVLGGFDARAQGLGGWTLDVNHLYDARTHTVHLGSGGHINADPIITTAAGNGNAPSFPRQGDGQEGPTAPLGEPYEAEVGPDGTVYFTEVTQTNSGSVVGAVRKIDPDGHVRTLATGLGGTIGLGVADDGTVYVAESTQRRVQRITPDGVVHPFAGGGTATGEGIPAASAKLNYPSDVAVSSDGRVYIAENVLGGIGTIDHGIVREVGPDGLMTIVAGGGSPDDGVGDGGLATQARLESGAGIALGQSGELLIAETHRIRRVDAGGTITTIAGGGAPEHGDGDGGPATDATIAGSFAVDVASDGGVLFTDNGRVRRVALDGTITTLAGGGSCGPSVKCDIGDKGPAPQAVLPGGPGGVAAAPDGSFYITTGGDEGHSGRIRKVARPLTKTDGGRGVVPATDGSEAYEFDDRGRHLKTLDGLTGATLLSFAYDAAGRVAKVTDGDGNATTVERAPDGKPTAIVAPGGQRTQLEVNDDGWLDKVVSPAGETTRFQYKPDGLGLMAKLTDTSDEVHEFGYTGNGRLITDKDPDTGVQTLDMTAIDNGYRVTRTSALGRTRTYAVQRTNEGGTRMEQTTPTGAKTVVVTDNDGSQHITYPDGTKVDLGREPEGAREHDHARRPGAHGRDGRGGPGHDRRGARRPGPAEDRQAGRPELDVRVRRARRVKARTDAAGNRTEYGYDDADRLTSLKKPSGHVYGFAYDKAGNQKSVTMPDGDVHEVGHNGIGQLERFRPAGATQAQTRAYDKDHDLKSTKLAGGRTIMDGREAATGRVTGQGYAEAAVAYGFKDATERVTSIVSDPVAPARTRAWPTSTTATCRSRSPRRAPPPAATSTATAPAC